MLTAFSQLLARKAGQLGPVILMYHSVAPGKLRPDWPWAISMRVFRAQLDLLSDTGWRTATVSELVANAQGCADRTVAITFDDGYLDNLDACGELQRRGMRATLFTVTGCLGATPSWQAEGRPTDRIVNATELRELQAAGMEIGSHGVSHLRLTESDNERLRSEVEDSKTTLEQYLGTEVGSFAYPYGSWDARCEQAVRKAGYRAACTTRPGWGLRDNNPYQLRRLSILNIDTAATLARKLYFGSNDASWRRVAREAMQRIPARTQADPTL